MYFSPETQRSSTTKSRHYEHNEVTAKYVRNKIRDLLVIQETQLLFGIHGRKCEPKCNYFAVYDYNYSIA